jgi:citrate synthase
MSGGIYSDHGPDHITRASKSRQIFQMVGRSDGWAQEYLEHRAENRLKHPEPVWMENHPKRLERGFP